LRAISCHNQKTDTATPKAHEIMSVFVNALFVGLCVEEECLHGLYQVEDLLLMVTESNTKSLDCANQVVE
jgi:hypothetical protein